jgi:hypothetical protein
MRADVTLRQLRVFLLWVALSIFAATLVELILIEHTEEAIQWIPFVLCGVGIPAVIAALARPTRATLTLLRAVMAIDGIGGLVGVGYHIWSNFTFEADIRPGAAALDLVLPALKGAAPLVAPGMLLLAGVLAIAATVEHPAVT